MRRLYLITVFLILLLFAKAQIVTQITHYSVEDGLSENHALCMLQDRKGTMWFGTYDGLNKFDGYTFRNFKGRINQKYQLINYRINRLAEDRQGFLWLQTNDGRIYRFDPSTETFLAVPQCLDEYRNYKAPINKINLFADGSVWLFSNDSGNDGCFKIEETGEKHKIKLTHFSRNNGDLSSDKINKIYLDKNQNTWILTSNGINLLKKGNSKPIQLFKQIQGGDILSVFENQTDIYIGGEQGKLRIYNKNNGSLDLINTPFKSNVIDIEQINKNDIFLLTNTPLFYIYSISTNQFQSFRLNNLKNNQIHGCDRDKSNNVWIDTESPGAILFESETKKISYLQVETNRYVNPTETKFHLIEDKFDNIWVQTRTSGFYKYNKESKQLDPVPYTDERNISKLVHTALSDNQGNLWLSTYLQGIDKVVFRQSPFIFTRPYNVPVYTSNNEIRSVFQDSKNRLWVGSKKGFLYLYDEKRKFKGQLGFNGQLNSDNPFNIPVYDIMEDHTGIIWLATKGKGLYRLIRKSGDSFSVTNYQYDPKDIYTLSSNSVYSVFEDHLHRIWIGTFWGGLNLLDTQNAEARFISNRNKLKNYPINDCLNVRYITEDKKNNLFVGTTQGLVVFNSDRKKPEEIVFNRYVHNPADEFSLSGNDVQYILPAKKGDLYLALIGGGINILKGGYTTKPRFEGLRNRNGNSLNAVYTLKEDKKGCLWMSGQTQIVKYNPDHSKFDTYKPVSKYNYFFDEAAVCETKQGEIIYGTSDGFVSFNPLKINKSVYAPKICLTQLQVFNKTIQVGDDDSALKTTIDDAKELVLNHKQNIISIEYAALDYVNPQAIQYAYKLEGFEKNWNYVENQRTATYTNLPKGKYLFRVKSTNSDGEWVNNEKTIVIIKNPSFWESIWGVLFYIVVFLFLSVLTAYILFTIYKLRNEIDIEQRITNMKLRFFTDISHELRTPLTLISSPVDNLLQKEPLSAHAKAQLQIVQKNTNRMVRLINQILDFRKIQNKKMNLIIEQVNVAAYLEEICRSFKNLTEEKNIRLEITDNTGNTQLWIDKDKFEKIIYNLLSNAFKFTYSGNEIHVIVSEDTDHVFITVKDQGVGIAGDKLRILFDRFESFASQNVTSQASTGIGLSLTKELVELHHGVIEVESETGKGSAFKITFLKGFEHYGENAEFLLQDIERNEQNREQTDILNMDEAIDFDGEADTDKKQLNKLPGILIVEDNDELRSFLKSTLSMNFEVYEAENGRIALDMALTCNPDIIISDIMMPDMDGLKLARAIKEDINISHIPLILLTAKTDLESKLEAMETGVDDYITKPFSMTYLEARIDNLLKVRKQLQSYFKSSLNNDVITLSMPDISNLDDLFIKKTMKYLEENYDNSKLNIDDIASNTGVSRSSFFKKIKSLTGLAPVDFIREFRIQKAIQLIQSGETNISQIAYNIGIEDSRYFSQCFKQKYGMNPSTFIAKKSVKG